MSLAPFLLYLRARFYRWQILPESHYFMNEEAVVLVGGKLNKEFSLASGRTVGKGLVPRAFFETSFYLFLRLFIPS